MRIKLLVAKSLILALPLTLIPVFASSAPKVTPGSKCKIQKQKIDYQEKTYTCIKSGKKLIWNKGVVTVKPDPLTVVTPTPSPTPTPLPSP